MDLVASCKDKLAYFRIKELKDVLTQLGLSKQGKKQDLVDRILAILSDERVSGMWAKKNAVGKEKVAKLVDDTYRKMQVSGTAELASKSEAVSDGTNVKLKEETEDSHPIGKIRCLCGSTLPTDSMIKCEDSRCNVWQHIACVLIPEKTMEGVLPNPPDIFYCEICRLSRADPFWVTVAHPLYPVKLNISNVPTDGSNPSQSIEKTFQLTRADRDLLSKQEYDVQAWCMLLNDKVTFRMQWLQYADLQLMELNTSNDAIHIGSQRKRPLCIITRLRPRTSDPPYPNLVGNILGVPVRAINRPGSQLLGTNGRDDGPIITHCTRDGINKIFLGGCDARIFCLGIRIVKRRTLQQVLNVIPKEGEGERFEDALARVRRCVGGGAATENADSDSDIEVVADCIPVNLRCPMSGLRMKMAGRFKDCAHMGCFDLEVFVEMNQRSRKWQCPICLKNYTLDKIVVDPYFNKVTSKMQNCAEDVAEIEVKPDGSWRAKAEGGDRKGLGELGLWHFPDGTISSSMAVDSKPQAELKPIKHEVGSDNHGGLRIGIRKNQNGFWEFNKPDPMRGISAAARFVENFESKGQNIIPMSSSATVSGRDCEDGSVNQDAGTNLDFSAINGSEYESIPMNIDTVTQGFSDRVMSTPAGDAAVIFLSDSEEEIDPSPYTGTAYTNTGSEGEADPTLFTGAAYRDTGSGTSGVPFPDPQHVIPDPYYENPSLGGGGGSCLGLYGATDDDFGINLWSLPSASQGGPGFQLFGSDVDVADTLLDMQHNPAIGCPSINEYPLTEEATMRPATLVPDSANQPDMADGLLDNSLAFSGNDPSLQIFLPTRPSDGSASQSGMRNHPDVSNGIGHADWISLRLGNGVGMGHGESAAMSGLSIGQQSQRNDLAFDPIADSGSLLLGTDDSRSGKTNRQRSESPSPFSFPRQRRSVRSRLYLSIDSDSGISLLKRAV